MSDFDYYTVLEIPRNASEAVVRRAYRRLALRWHPDKNMEQKEEAERKFKEISEAYEILSDSEKRPIYDRGGKAALARHLNKSNPTRGEKAKDKDRTADPFQSTSHFHFAFRDPAEVFREFFGGWNPFEDMFRRHIHLHHNPHNLHHRTPYDKDPFPSRRRHFVTTVHPTINVAPRVSQPRVTIHQVHPPQTVHKPPVQPAQPQTVHSCIRTPAPSIRPTPAVHAHPASAPASAPRAMPPTQHNLLLSSFLSNPLFGQSPFASPLTRPPVTQIHQIGGQTPMMPGRFSSTSTRFLNGHQIVTRTVIENGRQTVTVEQDGLVLSMTVNGTAVPINR